MTEYELLTLSAEAAGYTLTNCREFMCRDGVEWNPLTDDGDALRLAVTLGLNIYPLARTATGQACSAVGTGSHGRLSEVVDPNNALAAHRKGGDV